MVKVKYIIITYLALGLALSLVIGIEYNSNGQEVLPTYYGSPFVFKQKSLGSSMESYYSIFGLIINLLIWSILLYFIDKGIKIISKSKTTKTAYKIIVGLLIIFSTFNIAFDSVMVGLGFNENLNYWYWNIDKEAEEYGQNYEGKFIIFRK